MTKTIYFLLNLDIIITNISVIGMCFALNRYRKRIDFLEAMALIRANHELWLLQRGKHNEQ